MAQLLLHYGNPRSSRRSGPHRNRLVPTRVQIGKYFLMFIMIFMTGIMSLLYLMHFTSIHTKGYMLKKLENEREELLNQQEIKRMNVAAVRSLNHIRESNKVQNMLPIKNPIYIKEPTVFASK